MNEIKYWQNKDWLSKEYQNKSVLQIAKDVGISKQSMLKWFKKFDISRRQGELAHTKGVYSQNNNYFQVIDSAEKAYWLGFIMADGNITVSKSNSYKFQLNISTKDKDHIYKFADHIQYTRKIVEYEVKSGFNEEQYSLVTLKVDNKIFCENLIAHGIIPQKTGHERIPNIDQKYLIDFIRGYFDGDGSISFFYRKDKPNTMCASIKIVCANKDFLIDLREVISQQCDITFSPKSLQHTINKISSLEISSIQSIVKFFNTVYYDNCLKLSRKYEKFIPILDYHNYRRSLKDIVRTSSEKLEN